ncbi:hypothetical protein ADK75_11325 [Streptomyces virginiae]|uniref:Uncharacterized protein n=2 Tax=Streptomyces virginiae TaxID=1961 RepID=A0A0L8MY84_STRVG|nr:hypothetical protein ADK75_11325 [Streptomyces virginiae]
MTGVWLDDIACRFAATTHDADELFARAWQIVNDMKLEPSGFLTREDPALFTTLRGSASAMLARLWVTGYLLGPVHEDVWPQEELTILLLQSLEYHADMLALSEALDHHTGYGAGQGTQNSEFECEEDGEPDSGSP